VPLNRHHRAREHVHTATRATLLADHLHRTDIRLLLFFAKIPPMLDTCAAKTDRLTKGGKRCSLVLCNDRQVGNTSAIGHLLRLA